MDKGRYAEAPLLYIHQPEIRKVDAAMQSQYRSKKKAKVKDSTDTESTPVYEHGTEELEDEEEKPKPKKGKSFQDMTIEEQLVYLTDKPDYSPRVTCSIRTTEKLYKGIITKYEDGIAFIRSGRRTVKVPKEDVERIRLLSL